MKYILCLLFLFSSTVYSCGDKKLLLKPFAKSHGVDQDHNLNVYSIYIPQKGEGNYLTKIAIEIPDTIVADLAYEDIYNLDGYYVSQLWAKKALEGEYIVKTMYSTREDGAVSLCGTYIDHKLVDLLKNGLSKESKQ